MKEKLLPCPFCGEAQFAKPGDVTALAVVEAALIHEGDSREDLCWERYVECQNCGALGPSADTRQAAIFNWNRRVKKENQK